MTVLAMGVAMLAAFGAGIGYAAWGATQGTAAVAAPAETSASVFTPATPFEIADAAGDAKDLGVTRVGYGPGCLINCARLPTTANQAGPGADAFDVLRVGLAEETPDAIVLQLTIAQLTRGFPELAGPGADRRVAEYTICWKPAPDNATRCALLDASTHHDTATLIGSFHVTGADACNDWAWCNWRVPVDVTYGAPGLIRFTVPKEMATEDGAPLAIAGLTATTGWFSTNKALPLWHLAWTAHVNGDHQHDHVGILEPADVADRTDATHEPVTLTPAAWTDAPADSGEPLMTPGLGNIAGGGGLRDYPELDLVAYDMREDGADLVATYQMAQFKEMPKYDLQFATIFGVKGGTTYEVGIMQSNGDAYGYAGRCISFGCHNGGLTKVPIKIDAAAGTVEVRAPRALWPTLEDGAETTFMIAYTMFGEASTDVGTPGAPVYGNVHSGSVVDIAMGGAPYVMGSTHGAKLAAPAHEH